MRRSPRPTARRAAALVAVVAVGLLAALAPAGAAGAQDGPAPTLDQVLADQVDGVSARAWWVTRGDGDMVVEVGLANETGAPVEVAVPFGALFATEEEGHQTLTTAGPDDPGIATGPTDGGVVVEVAAGSSTLDLRAFCAEAEDGAPYDRTPVRSLGVAADPLPTVARNVFEQQPGTVDAQDAVWWVTDEPVLPVPEHIAPLLRGVDVEAFAAQPHRVVPDTGYDPIWARGDGAPLADVPDRQAAGIFDEAFDGGSGSTDRPDGGLGDSGPGFALWAVLVGLGLVGLIVVAARQSSRAGAARVESGLAPGWYRDPVDPSRLRWWDGRGWTAHRR